MPRRKSKAKQEEEFIKTLFGMVTLLTFVGVYYFSGSLKTSIGAAIVALVCVIAMLIALRMKRMERLRKSGIADIDKMGGRQFEIYLGELFKKHGYVVKVTRSTGDFGADLIISKEGKKIVVQAKRYSKAVGIKAVQEAQASIAHYNASAAWVVSNNEYTDAAKELARSNNVRLINREELITLILKMNPETATGPQKVIQANPEIEKQCSKCGSPMVLRKSAKGEFFGCSCFPKCRNILNIH
ncbi:restriction endonuclease [Paenibacillus sp. MZ04-78.2]|uniref:restriction endonuclease n=1 Tax=Paenibacillus sp. MZ04-78.2 TaxID=2962034 RepID=UPI0020B681FC|nr:restriction endonuclease [Paenibacillus sp. MZ04-78.2]MCP3773813.1 restriction endonuclease [Paenibacillus sp. MZ04-78.2]